MDRAQVFLYLDVLLVTKPKSNLVCQASAGQVVAERDRERKGEGTTCNLCGCGSDCGYGCAVARLSVRR